MTGSGEPLALELDDLRIVLADVFLGDGLATLLVLSLMVSDGAFLLLFALVILGCGEPVVDAGSDG